MSGCFLFSVAEPYLRSRKFRNSSLGQACGYAELASGFAGRNHAKHRRCFVQQN
jgi:hypothetical protein